MEINWKLVDQFQQCFRERATFERMPDFLFVYISQVRAPLPPIAAQGLEVARNFREGTATTEDRVKASGDIWNYVRERKAWRDTTSEFCIMRAITLLLRDQLEPGEKETISETRRDVLWMIDRFEDHSDTADFLIRQFFATKGNELITNEMQEAHSKVVQMALPKPN